MVYRPVYCRTRAKREEAILQQYWQMKKKSGVSPAPRRKKMKTSNNSAYVSHISESSSRKPSFEWVAEDIESLTNQQNVEGFKDSAESVKSGKQGMRKRKRNVEVIELDDSDEEVVVVSKGKEEIVDVGDCDSDEEVDDASDSESEEDVTSAEEDDIDDDGEFISDEESTEEGYVDVSESSSDEDCSMDKDEEEDELVKKSETESKAESIQIGLKRKADADGFDLHSFSGCVIDDGRNTVSKEETVEGGGREEKISDVGDDLHSSSGCDIDDRSKKVRREETFEGGLEGNSSDNGEGLHSCSAHDTDVTIEQVWKEEGLTILPKEKTNADGDDHRSSSGHDIDDRSVKLGEALSVFAEERTRCNGTNDYNQEKLWKEEIIGVDLKENRSGDGYNLHASSVHDINEKSRELEKVGGLSAEGKEGCDNRREDGIEGKTNCAYSKIDNNGIPKAESETGSAGRIKDDTKSKGKIETAGCKTWSGRWNDMHTECKTSAGFNSLTKRKSASVPKQKRSPTIEFQPPKDVKLSLKFSFDKQQPSIPEKSAFDREVEDLLDQWSNAMADDSSPNDSKAKSGDDARSESRVNACGDEPQGGTARSGFDKGTKFDVQRGCVKDLVAEDNSFSRAIGTQKDDSIIGTSESGSDKGRKCDVQIAYENGVEAKGNNSPRSTDTPKDDNGGTNGGSCPEPYKKRGVRKLAKKRGIKAPKDSNAFTLLVDSIYEELERPGEQLPPLENEDPKDEVQTDQPLPLFFNLGPPPIPGPEKSAHDIETEYLFEQFEFVRMSGEIGSYYFNAVEPNDSIPPGTEVTQLMLCNQGKHDLKLDEEIGLICQYCFHVEREIKYILPDFAPNPYGKSGKGYYEEDNLPVLDDLQCNPDDSGISSHVHKDGTVWDLIPGVKDDMYPHQQKGFEFIWRNLAGGIQLGELEKPTADGGDGCIISHAPGTGKTRLTIIFIQSYMNFNPKSRPLIVAPRTMLLTWEEEFKKWGFDIPFHNLNNRDFTGKEDETARNLVKDVNRTEQVDCARIVKLKSWAQKRSILGISYALFEMICGAPTKKGKKVDGERRKSQLEKMSKILLEFPDLVVFDEGHNPRNDQSHSWNALLKLKTRRRIILSGTPFQNNFEELYNTVHLVRPEWTTKIGGLGAFDKKQWTSDQGGRSSNAGTADDNTKRAKEVRAMISPFVDVYKGAILHDKLPGLRNSVIVLQPTALQQRYSDRSRQIKNPFKYERIEAKITIHPFLMEKEFEGGHKFHKEDEYSSADREMLPEIKLKPEYGVKARFAVDLVRLCQAMNERVLIFSQWVDPLSLLKDQLKSQFQWKDNEEVIYMDGTCDANDRQTSMNRFNDPSGKAKVMLATTRGCNEGISLVGASRVILLDVAWNPSVERQAISRAYRLGQKKIVFIYHLLMAGAREEDKYTRQVEKHRLSELVFSSSHTEADAKKLPAEDTVLDEMVHHEKLKHIFHKITLLDEASYLGEDFI